MTITATELKKNLKKYLELSEKEDIYITKNGKVISKLTSPYKNKMDAIKKLKGCIKSDASLEELKDERLSNI